MHDWPGCDPPLAVIDDLAAKLRAAKSEELAAVEQLRNPMHAHDLNDVTPRS